MKRTSCLTLAVLVLISFLLACSPTPSPSPAPTTVANVGRTAGWEESWNRLVREAKTEGKVVLYNTWPVELRPALTKMFKDQFGIELEWVTGRGAELVQKIRTERRAGIYVADITTLGLAQYVSGEFEPITDPVAPLLFQPDVKDTSKWFGGKLPLVDTAGHVFAFIAARLGVNIYNGDLVKDGEITSMRQFMDPKWKGRIVMLDPTSPTTGLYWYQFVLNHALGREKGREYMKQLARNAPAATRETRSLTEWVARGKYALGINSDLGESSTFMREGAPVKLVQDSGDKQKISHRGTLLLLKDRPHPRATQLFVNWLLTKEVLSEVVRGTRYPVTRVDVDTQHVNPMVKMKPGDVLDDEAAQAELSQMLKMAQEDFGVLFE